MNAFINHVLMMLEDNGMNLGYPEIQHLDPVNGTTDRFSRYVGVFSHFSQRVTIEQNQKAKFNIVFSILDSFIDTNYPSFEGLTFKKKYDSLPASDVYQQVIKELYRIAKILRNALVHGPSNFKETINGIEVSYTFKNTNFELKMSSSALNSFYTAIVMYVKNDMGTGAYFTGYITTLYKEIFAGITKFNDEINKPLLTPPNTIAISTNHRVILRNPNYSFSPNLTIHNDTSKSRSPYEGLDYYFTHTGIKVLIPQEALDAGPIDQSEAVNKWKYQGRFPAV